MPLTNPLYTGTVQTRPFVGFRLNSPATRRRLDREASRRGLSLSDLCRLALYDFLTPRASVEGHSSKDAFDEFHALPFSD
jgi:hypothetical protein